MTFVHQREEKPHLNRLNLNVANFVNKCGAPHLLTNVE